MRKSLISAMSFAAGIAAGLGIAATPAHNIGTILLGNELKSLMSNIDRQPEEWKVYVDSPGALMGQGTPHGPKFIISLLHNGNRDDRTIAVTWTDGSATRVDIHLATGEYFVLDNGKCPSINEACTALSPEDWKLVWNKTTMFSRWKTNI
jgi:hypothetical protein